MKKFLYKAKEYIPRKIDKLFFRLLKRHLVKRMDQWSRWEISVDDQKFYVEMYRGEGDGHSYDKVEEKNF